MPDLKKLRKNLTDAQSAFAGAMSDYETAYNEARAAFDADPTDANHTRYKKAKKDFVEARVEVRRMEEADPDNSRGQGEGTGLVTITDEAGA